MTRRFLAAAALAWSLLACAKGPAEAAIKAADQAMQAARPEVETYLPDEWKALTESAQAARDSFKKGEYKKALATAQEIPARVQAAVEAARRKKEGRGVSPARDLPDNDRDSARRAPAACA